VCKLFVTRTVTHSNHLVLLIVITTMIVAVYQIWSSTGYDLIPHLKPYLVPPCVIRSHVVVSHAYQLYQLTQENESCGRNCEGRCCIAGRCQLECAI